MTPLLSRYQVITQLKNYFSVKELVCNHTYAKWGERSWRFLDTKFLHCLLVIRRDIIARPMTCNSMTAHQRGLRCNCCDMVKGKTTVYLSGHIFGKAGDFTISGMTAEDARRRIKAAAHLLPYPVRLEAGVTWLHFDVMDTDDEVQPKITEFTA